MKKLTIVLAGFISILFATSAIAQVPTDQARNFQIDATHTGAVTSPGLTPPLKQRWVVNFGQPISYPLIADGRVFVTVKENGNGTKLFALDPANGAILWSTILGGSVNWSASCYENGRVFAMNSAGVLRAFDAATGTLIWSTFIAQNLLYSPPTVFQGVIYLSADSVFAVSADTGAVLWTKSVFGGDTSSPAVTSDGLWVSYSCPNVYKLNPATGAQIWSYSPGCSGGGGQTPVLYNGRLYVRDIFSPDSIFNADTGTIIGNFIAKNNPAFLGATGFFLDGSKVYGSFGTLRARDINTNAELWSFAGDGQLQSAVLVVNDFVYVGSASGKLYALDAATGRQAWVTTAGASIPYVDEIGGYPTTGFAAGEGLLVIPTSTTLVAYDVDNSPPVLTFGNQMPAANAAGWNNTPVDVPFTTTGVRYADPVSPLHFASDGTNQIQDVTLTDRNGNQTSVTSPVINIDMTAPATSANITGSGGEWSTSVQVALSSNDNLSGVANTFYKIDGGAVQTYTSEFSVSNNGTHTVSYWSVDVAGNTESTHSSTFKVDNTAPVTQLSTSGTAGTNGWFKSAVQVSLSASDSNQSGVASTSYSVDGGATQPYTGAFSIGNEGVHQVNFWSVDVAGNTEAQQSVAVKIDWTGPTALHSLSGVLNGLGYYTTPVQVTINSSDNLSGVGTVYYRINGGNTINYTGAFTVSTDGTTQIDYSNTDVAGNNNLNWSTVIFRIDKTPPVTVASFSQTNLGNNGWYRGTVQISMSATDNVSGVEKIQYTIDNGTLKIYSAPFNYSTSGIHSLNYWSNDKVFNYEPSHFVQLKIDQQSPSVSMSATPGSVVASSTPVTVTVSGRITDALSGIDPASVFYNVIDEYSVISLSGPVTLQPNGDFSFTLSLPATKNAGDRQHVYTIYVSAADMAGISKSVNDTVKIN